MQTRGPAPHDFDSMPHHDHDQLHSRSANAEAEADGAASLAPAPAEKTAGLAQSIAHPQLSVWNATLLHIYISAGHDYWGKQGEGRLQNGIQEVEEVECVAGKGLRGDRYFGYRTDYKGQITFFAQEIVAEVRLQFKLPRLPPSVFRRNAIVQGVDLQDWMGKRFIFQGIEFEGSQECRPCYWMDRAVAPGAEDFLKGKFRGGLRAKIVTNGTLRVG